MTVLIRRGSLVRIQPDPPLTLERLKERARINADPQASRYWGISSAGRAPALQAGGRRFDPVILPQSSMHSILYTRVITHWRLSQSVSNLKHSALSCAVVL